jgi:hypothetical protein
VSFLLALLLLAPAGPAPSPTADVAERLQGKQAECSFLVGLCKQVNLARDAAVSTPPSANVLATRSSVKLDMTVRDAVDAARVIERKHDGKRPACFQDPRCRFLDAAMRAP